MESKYSYNYKETFSTNHKEEKIYNSNENDLPMISLEKSPSEVDEVLFSTSSKKNKNDSENLIKYRKINLGLDFNRTENLIKIKNNHRELREKRMEEKRIKSINLNKDIINQIMQIIKRDDKDISLSSFGFTNNDFLTLNSLVGGTRQILNSLKPINYLNPNNSIAKQQNNHLPTVNPKAYNLNILNKNKDKIFPTELTNKNSYNISKSYGKELAIPKEIILEENETNQVKPKQTKFTILKNKQTLYNNNPNILEDRLDKCSYINLDPSKFIPKRKELYTKITIKDFMSLGRLINKPFK